MKLRIEDRVALVVGGTRGIGRAAAQAFASAGARVTICSRDPKSVALAAEEIRKASSVEVIGIPADCSRESDVANLMTQVIDRFGQVDVLLNSLQGPKAVPFLESSDQDWLEALNGKLMGQIRCARAVFPHMARQRWGRIINIGGTHGHIPSAYAMSAGVVNAALENFTRALAELGAPSNVLVNMISPGPILTDRTEYLIKMKAQSRRISEEEASAQHRAATLLNRIGSVDEVTPLIMLLASEQASYMTAGIYAVDGGQYRAE